MNSLDRGSRIFSTVCVMAPTEKLGDCLIWIQWLRRMRDCLLVVDADKAPYFKIHLPAMRIESLDDEPWRSIRKGSFTPTTRDIHAEVRKWLFWNSMEAANNVRQFGIEAWRLRYSMINFCQSPLAEFEEYSLYLPRITQNSYSRNGRFRSGNLSLSNPAPALRFNPRGHVLIYVGASCRHKRWHLSRFVRLADNLNYRVRFVAGPHEKHSAPEAGGFDAFERELFDRVGGTYLSASDAGLATRLALDSIVVLVSDTGLAHHFAQLSVPTVVMFGFAFPGATIHKASELWNDWMPIGPAVHPLYPQEPSERKMWDLLTDASDNPMNWISVERAIDEIERVVLHHRFQIGDRLSAQEIERVRVGGMRGAELSPYYCSPAA